MLHIESSLKKVSDTQKVSISLAPGENVIVITAYNEFAETEKVIRIMRKVKEQKSIK